MPNMSKPNMPSMSRPSVPNISRPSLGNVNARPSMPNFGGNTSGLPSLEAHVLRWEVPVVYRMLQDQRRFPQLLRSQQGRLCRQHRIVQLSSRRLFNFPQRFHRPESNRLDLRSREHRSTNARQCESTDHTAGSNNSARSYNAAGSWRQSTNHFAGQYRTAGDRGNRPNVNLPNVATIMLLTDPASVAIVPASATIRI